MKITVIAVGTRMPDWVQIGLDDYIKRFPRDFSVTLLEVKPEPRTSGKPPAQLMQHEARRIEAVLPARNHLVALDENGRNLSTMQIARQLGQWRDEGLDTTFIIGGPDGLDPELKTQCHSQWRLSSLTLAHPFVRVLLAEQLYRAWSILANHPYHRS